MTAALTGDAEAMVVDDRYVCGVCGTKWFRYQPLLRLVAPDGDAEPRAIVECPRCAGQLVLLQDLTPSR